MWYADDDGDGYGDPDDSQEACEKPNGYVNIDDDCNDDCSACNPGASEVGDALDNDCDGKIDEGLSSRDEDGDCYCSAETCTSSTSTACSAPRGGTCFDGDSNIHPGAVEVCDGVDQNCDGIVDDGFDSDGDQPSPSKLLSSSHGIVDDGFDSDGNGYTVCAEPDADREDETIHPGAHEVCNGVDDNCDIAVDEGFDIDSDGYTTCDVDCDDGSTYAHPGAVEVCNGVEDDCDSAIDDGVTLTYYRDADLHGCGSSGSGTTGACAVSSGYSSSNNDCNDTKSTIHPGATETCNTVEDDCDALIDEGFDQDGDGYNTCENDGNDSSAATYPGASETCDSHDNDCDGLTDEDRCCDNARWDQGRWGP